MDPSKKRRLVLEGDSEPLDLSGWVWDEWEYEENKENVSVNTGASNPEEPQAQSAPVRAFDLTRWRRCEVKTVTKLPREVRLSLMEDDVPQERAQTGQLILYHNWIYTEVNPLDVVSVKASWSEDLQCHIITMQEGLLVVNPSLLVSGTTLLGSLFCSRKGILEEYFRTIAPEPQIMTVGSMVHELLQMCLEEKLETREQILEGCRKMFQNQRTSFQIFSSSLNAQDAEEEMFKFVPKIHDFIQHYMMNRPTKFFNKSENFSGTIVSVQDIEENIWMPHMGLKGKVDVSVRVRKKTPDGVVIKTMPLEVKTGRASFTPEHRGQLTLYQMMMAEVHKDVESGLLLYLREGIFHELKPSWNEVRDLIMMRNRYVSYLASEKVYLDEAESEFKLPEPINHPTACPTCPMNTICGTFLLRSQQRELITPGHSMLPILQRISGHLSKEHVDYFIDWVQVVLYEQFYKIDSLGHERIWTKTPEAREKEGFTLAYMVITTPPTREGVRFLTDFRVDKSQPGGSKRDCLTAGFSTSDYLIVSTSRRIAVATGTVTSIEPGCICLSLERDLRALYPRDIFHIDRYESKMTMTYNLTTLGALLSNTVRSNELRRLIVDKVPPVFRALPEGERVVHEGFWNLNDNQMDAIMKSVHLQEYMLLEGLPGTGKTETIIAIVRYYFRQGWTILITSHTNAAVDNFLERLLPFDIPFMRLGAIGRVLPSLQKYTEAHITRNCESAGQLQMYYNSCQIIAVTCLGCNHPLLVQREFDLCIVDEATQVFQPTVLRPLLSAKKFILAGDSHQLPPLITSDQALALGGEQSLFKRLQTPHTVATLRTQYRMNQTIMNVANNLAYNGLLTCANDTVANNVIQYAPEVVFTDETCPFPWLYKVLQTDLRHAFMYIDTGNMARAHVEFTKQINMGDSKKEEILPESLGMHLSANICEAALCLYIVRALTELGIEYNDIGIITPFRAQVTLLKQFMVKFNEVFGVIPGAGVEVNTVDQYQGREKSVIIYSCVTNCNNKSILCPVDQRVMGSPERFAVALTRAKHKCIVIGNVASLEGIGPFKNLRRGMLPEGFMKLIEGQSGFQWQVVLHHLLDIYQKNLVLLENPIFELINSFCLD